MPPRRREGRPGEGDPLDDTPQTPSSVPDAASDELEQAPVAFVEVFYDRDPAGDERRIREHRIGRQNQTGGAS
jgi:hypothetical protein